MPPFELHPRLAQDSVAVGAGPLSRIRLIRDARYPWVVLIPNRASIREIHALDPTDQQTLMGEISRVGACMEVLFEADKVNVAALGNLVPQLHVHVVARTTTDDAWPGAIWGAHPPRPYGSDALKQRVRALQTALAGDGFVPAD
jgi:diadenosine tetraphosphate (Ap4A) HIT family hydrolase